MYDEHQRICETIAADRTLQAAVFRAAGDAASVAGTDISQLDLSGWSISANGLWPLVRARPTMRASEPSRYWQTLSPTVLS
jgi:hypothetical protein